MIHAQKHSPAKKVRLCDVAAAAAVSVTTASRILNAPPDQVRVARATRDRVLKSALKLGYASPRIVSQLNRTVMILSTDPRSLLYQTIISSIEKSLRQDQYDVAFGYSEGKTAIVRQYIDMMEKNAVSGCIIFQKRDEAFDNANLSALRSLHIPCVTVLNQPVPCPDFVSTVVLDDSRAGYDVAAHLLQLGHRQFGYLMADESLWCSQRLNGVIQCLSEASVSIPDDYIARVYPGDRFQLFEILKNWLAPSDSAPTALICANDDLGYAVVNVLEQLSVSIPHDVSVAGFDDLAALLPGLLESMRIALTSISQPAEIMGIAAAREIINRIQNPDYAARHTPIPGTLSPRSSTAFSPKILVS